MSGITAPTLTGVVNNDPITEGISLKYYYKVNDGWEETTAENAGASEEGVAPVWGGSYKVVATFAGNSNYTEQTKEATFSITRVTPSFETFDVPHYAVYDGTAKCVTATVKGVPDDETVYEAKIAYAKKDAAGQYVALADGVQPIEAGEYQATATYEDRNYTKISNTLPFAIQTKQLTEEMVTLSKKEFFYNEETQQPTVTVKVGETVLREGTDYTVNRPTESKKIGKYELTVIGKGNYEGEVKVEYLISAVPQVPYYTVVLPESIRGAVLVGGGTHRQERNSFIDFRIELDPNGGGKYPRVTVSGTGKTLTPDANGNYRLQVTCDTYVLIDEITDYSYYVLSCPADSVPASSTTYWSAEGIEVTGAAAAPDLRAVSDTGNDRFLAPFGATVTLRPIETERRKFLMWEDGSSRKERTLTLRADQEIKALWKRISPTGIEAIADGSMIRGERGQLYIEVPEACDVTLYTYGGVPVRVARLAAGANRLANLNAGLYLVKIGAAPAVPVRVR